jgi:hypothetical protein
MSRPVNSVTAFLEVSVPLTPKVAPVALLPRFHALRTRGLDAQSFNRFPSFRRRNDQRCARSNPHQSLCNGAEQQM